MVVTPGSGTAFALHLPIKPTAFCPICCMSIRSNPKTKRPTFLGDGGRGVIGLICRDPKASGCRPALLNHTPDARVGLFIDERLQGSSGPINIKDRMNVASRSCYFSIHIDALP
jgi:hypothetical protein